MNTKNLIFLVGRLVADPELKYLNNGAPVANFALAVNRSTRKADGSWKDDLDFRYLEATFRGRELFSSFEKAVGTPDSNSENSTFQKRSPACEPWFGMERKTSDAIPCRTRRSNTRGMPSSK